MTSSYERAFTMLCQFEGYSSDVKGDSGGLTIFGITERWFPNDVKAMLEMSYVAAFDSARDALREELESEGDEGCVLAAEDSRALEVGEGLGE